jgi:ABC-2 type transport system permease protein
VNKVLVVLSREFLSTVKRRSYLIVTFGMPFFLSTYLGMIALLPALYRAQSSAAEKGVGLVDEAGVVRPEEIASLRHGGAEAAVRELKKRLGSGSSGGRMAAALIDQAMPTVDFRMFGTREKGLEVLRRREIDRLYVIPADYVQNGGVESYRPKEASVGIGRSKPGEALETLLSRSLLSGRVPDELRARIQQPLSREAARQFTVGRDGRIEPFDVTERIARMAIPGVFAILFLMSVMISSGYLLQGVSEEKENRVIEVILSSVRPDQLLFGKLLGLGAAGLLQLVIWLSVASMATSLIAAAALAVLDFKLFAGCLVFFVLGFLMLGGLMVGTGALGSTARESQQMAAIWSTLTIVPPAFTWMVILEAPNGALARTLSWFPLTAPITMMLRLGTGEVPWWDVLVGALCLAVGVYLAVRASAALFRLGLLMYGKRPTMREIVRQLRHA